MTSRIRNARCIGGLLAAIVLQACGPWPRDPEGTHDRAAGGTLTVGVTEAEPWLTRGDEGAGGPEAELVLALARSIGARVDWRWGAIEEHLHALERYELDVVAGGMTARSPWKARVGLTRPWRVDGDSERVLAVPPGENRMLVALERLIEARRQSARP